MAEAPKGFEIQELESSSTTAPWEPQQPYILGGFQAAKNLYDMGLPEYYPGETLAGFDPVQQQAQQAILGYSMGPRVAGMQAGAEGALMRSLGGYTGFTPQQTADLLAGNVRTGAGTPYQAMADALSGDVVNRLQGSILPGIRQQQVMYQPGGSSRAALEQNKAVTSAVKQGLTTPLAQMYQSAYDRAQQMRLPASQQMIQQQQFGQQQYPTTMTAPYAPLQAMNQVGEQRRAMSQEAINRDMARYFYEAGAPQQALQNYMSMITGNYGSSSTAMNPYVFQMPQRQSFGQNLFSTALQMLPFFFL
jgi:hypothetical protein